MLNPLELLLEKDKLQAPWIPNQGKVIINIANIM